MGTKADSLVWWGCVPHAGLCCRLVLAVAQAAQSEWSVSSFQCEDDDNSGYRTGKKGRHSDLSAGTRNGDPACHRDGQTAGKRTIGADRIHRGTACQERGFPGANRSAPFPGCAGPEQGQLERDRALLENARVDLIRYQKLNAQDSVARQTLDTQVALVHQYEGTVKMDQGQVESAQVNLDYCHIVSPVDGIVGLRQVDQGNYVQTSDTSGLVVITQIDPMTVIFTVTEDEISKVTARLIAGAALPVTAYDRTNSDEIAHGTLGSVDNQVDTTTGTVKLRAVFDNRDGKLFPQQFVNAKILVDTLHDAVLVPTAAIQIGAPGSYVYVVNSDSTVSVRVITPGPIDGERAAVLSGLDVGETVVIDGVDRLYDGARVQLPAKRPGSDESQRPHRFSERPDGSPREHHHHGGNGNEQQSRPPNAS